MATMRLMYSPGNQVFVFTFGDSMTRLEGEPMFFKSKDEAIGAARKKGLSVDRKGLVSGNLEGVTNQKDYTHYVVVWPGYLWNPIDGEEENTDKKHAKIETGWSAKEDAKDRYTEIVDVESEGTGPFQDMKAKVVAKSSLKSWGLDPENDAHWYAGGTRRRWPAGTKPAELGEVSARTRQGSRVRFNPSPASLALYFYTRPPRTGEEGSVTTMPGFGKRTYLPGPGGLLYVKWDESGTVGVSPRDVDKVTPGRMRAGPGRPGMKFERDGVEYETTLHPIELDGHPQPPRRRLLGPRVRQERG